MSNATRAVVLPAGAVDCHHHVYDRRFPAAADARLRPPDAGVGDYLDARGRFGTSRSVVVQPSTYGSDNRLLVRALHEFGPAARGVAVVDADVADRQLRELDSAGVRGIRVNLRMGPASSGDVPPLARRAAQLGWHLQLLAPPSFVEENLTMLASLPVPLVLDHLALLPPGDRSTVAPSTRAVLRLLETGNTWVKLSGIEILSRSGPPGYADQVPVAGLLVRRAPERLLWGSNWPYPAAAPQQRPDDAGLVDFLIGLVPDASVRHRILVDNPESLFGFDARCTATTSASGEGHPR
jgi:D-galactarolactone isomerase